MRILVFSDVHGNIYALQEFMKQIELIEYDKIVFCGDIFGYYYNQREVFDILSGIDNLLWLKGNHDDYFVKVSRGEMSLEMCILQYGHSYEIALSKFSHEEVDYIDGLQSEYILDAEGAKLGIFHGTPYDSLNGRLYPDNHILETEKYMAYDIVVLGHTHCRMCRYEGDTLIVNSGSLGQPRDGSGFGYAVINTVTKSVDFFDVNFDKKKLYEQIDIYDSGLTKLKEVIERRKK